MKFKVYQDGGGLIYTPFIPQPYVSDTGSKKESSSTEDKLDPLDKEIIALMKDQNLLPSDIAQIYNKFIAFQRKSQSLVGMGGSYRSAMPGMLQIMNLVSQAKYNKLADDAALQKMSNENAGDEPALDKYGRLYVKTKDGEISTIKPSDFNSEEHIPLSNSQLLYLREREPSLAFDGTILENLRNVVGMSSVSKEIDRIIKDFGTEEGQRYLSKDAAKAFLDMKSPEGLYKLTQKGPSKGLREAWDAIWDMLPANMQNLLKARAEITGVTPKEFIADIVLRNTTRSQSIDYDEGASKAAGYDTDPTQTQKESTTEMPYLMQIGNLKGSRTLVTIAPRAAKIQDTAMLTSPAFTYGYVVDKDNKPIEMMTLNAAMHNGKAFSAGNPDTVVFGNKLLNKWERDALMFDDSSNLTVVMLPFKEEMGHKVPDFSKLDSFNKLQKVISDNPGITKTELMEQAKKLDINWSELNYDETTNTISIKDTMPFISVSAYAGDNTIDLSKENQKYLEKIDKEDGQHLKDFYNNLVTKGALRPAKKAGSSITGYSKSKANDFWRGNVFIPMNDAYYSMLLSGKGETISKSDLTDYSGRVAARNYEVMSQQNRMNSDPNYEKNRSIGQFNNE